MVSGNAMRTSSGARPTAATMVAFASSAMVELVASLLERPSVDVLVLPHSEQEFEVRCRARGTAMICARHGSYTTEPSR
jgi:hypothetical protein